MSPYQILTRTRIAHWRILLGIATGAIAACIALPAHAATFDGAGLLGGLDAAGGIAGLAQGTLPDFVRTVLDRILNYATLAGVVVVVAAGFYLILGFGSDTSKDTAKKMIIYTAVGLVILQFADIIVGFFATAGAEDIHGPVENLLNRVVTYLTLAGVVVIVTAGFYLILGFGSDASKDAAKKMITYTIAGLLVVFFARLIVVFFLSIPAFG